MKNNQNQRFVFLTFTGILFFMLSPAAIFAQSNISIYKDRLEKLNQQLLELDDKQRDELAMLGKQSSEKGEFETTKQFEERSANESVKTNELYNELDRQQGTVREKIYKEINEILSTEIPDNFQAVLGPYDADKRQFPIITNGGFQDYLFVPLEEARDVKNNFAQAEKTGIMGLFLDEKNNAREYLIAGKISYGGKIYAVNTSAFNSSRAMRMLFGNYDENSKFSAWTLHVQKFFVDGSDEDVYVPATVYAKILAVRSYSDQGVDKRVLVTQTAPTLEDNSCHACSVFISVAVFSKQNGFWKIEQAQKNTGRYGSWGEVSPPEVVKIGTNKYALKYVSYYMGMGNEDGGEEFITIDGGIFNVIFTVTTYQNNTGASPPIKDQIVSRSKIVFRPTVSLGYFDISVNSSGKKGKKIGKRYVLSPFTQTDLYRFSEGKYREVK